MKISLSKKDNMKYIINKTILYSPDTKKLSLLLDNESYVLISNQASRLIIEMIQKNKSTLSREYLLKHVWDDFGAVPSNNSLYMAVSELRKAFRSLGVTEKLIQTIPKTGFIFEAAIDILPSSSPNSNGEKIPQEVEIVKTIHFSWQPRYIAISMVIIIIALALVSFVNLGKDSEIKKDYLNVEFAHGKCNFYALGNKSPHDKEIILSYLSSNLVKETLPINCSEKMSDIYYQVIPSPIHEIFISSCEKNTLTEEIVCNSLRTDYE